MTSTNRPRKMTVLVTIKELVDYGPSAKDVKDTIRLALGRLDGIIAEVEVTELECNCGDDAWPSYCAYHNKRYGY